MTREEAIEIFRKEVECLSHSRCEDCILEKACDPMKTPLDSEYIEAYEISIKALEQEPKWIPVSERLPEVGSEVLVCFDFKGKRSVYISDFYGDGEFHGFDDEYLTPEGRKCRKAVAWMPLPEPYKAESEDKE